MSLSPVACTTVAVRNLFGGRLPHPVRGDNLLVAPLAFLEIELTEPCDVLCLDAQSPAPAVDPLRPGLPGLAMNSKGMIETALQVVHHPHPGQFLDDGGEH